MAFSSQKLPNSELSGTLENALMQQWEAGYRDGVESCATMLEIIAQSLVENNETDMAYLLRSLSKNFREQANA